MAFRITNPRPLLRVVSKTSSFTANPGDDVYTVSTAGGAVTATLYSAAGVGGSKLTLKKTTSDSNLLTVAAAGSETIDGVASKILLKQYDAISLVSDGTNWMIQNSVLLRNVVTSSAGGSTVTSTTYVDVTNLTCTITTRGYPVEISVIGDGSATGAQFGISSSNIALPIADFQILRDATAISIIELVGRATTSATDDAVIESAPSGIRHYDEPAQGTYTYKIQSKITGAGTSAVLTNVKLVVREITA